MEIPQNVHCPSVIKWLMGQEGLLNGLHKNFPFVTMQGEKRSSPFFSHFFFHFLHSFRLFFKMLLILFCFSLCFLSSFFLDHNKSAYAPGACQPNNLFRICTIILHLWEWSQRWSSSMNLPDSFGIWDSGVPRPS